MGIGQIGGRSRCPLLIPGNAYNNVREAKKSRLEWRSTSGYKVVQVLASSPT